jgi:hypothetical protein
MVQNVNKSLRINCYSPNTTESTMYHESFLIHGNDQTCDFSLSNAPIISSLFQKTTVPDHDRFDTRYVSCTVLSRNRVSSGSIVSDYGLDDQAIGVRSPAGAKDFSCSLCVQTGSCAHPASCPMGTGGPFPGVKARPGCDADHSPPYSAEVVNE